LRLDESKELKKIWFMILLLVTLDAKYDDFRSQWPLNTKYDIYDGFVIRWILMRNMIYDGFVSGLALIAEFDIESIWLNSINWKHDIVPR
jgi:hypothetical protein